MNDFLFNNWATVLRTLLLGSLSYIALLFFLRISGKRTLSKINMFDFTVTMAFGPTLATVILSKDVSLIQGIVGLALLVLLQFLITFLEIRSDRFRRLVKSSPILLFFNNNYLEDSMKKERVVKAEIRAAIRQKWYASSENINAVILETDETFSVLVDNDLKLEGLKSEGIIVNS